MIPKASVPPPDHNGVEIATRKYHILFLYSFQDPIDNMCNKSPDSASKSSRFAFVDDNAPSKARSHAMREYWNQRHRRQQRSTYSPGQNVRNLLPRLQQNERVSSYPNNTTEDGLSTGKQTHAEHGNENNSNIAVQFLTSLSGALLTSRPDPFQTCPINLTSQHQKLLHHCMYPRGRGLDCIKLIVFRDMHPRSDDV